MDDFFHIKGDGDILWFFKIVITDEASFEIEAFETTEEVVIFKKKQKSRDKKIASISKNLFPVRPKYTICTFSGDYIDLGKIVPSSKRHATIMHKIEDSYLTIGTDNYISSICDFTNGADNNYYIFTSPRIFNKYIKIKKFNLIGENIFLYINNIIVKIMSDINYRHNLKTDSIRGHNWWKIKM